jgi:hypothetical protein
MPKMPLAKATVWSRLSRRIDPISLSQYPFCQGDRNEVGRGAMNNPIPLEYVTSGSEPSDAATAHDRAAHLRRLWFGLDGALAITDADQVNALGFCVGGTLLGCAAAVLAARSERKIASLTLMTTMPDFSDAGEIGLLIDATGVAARYVGEPVDVRAGLLSREQVEAIISSVRPEMEEIKKENEVWREAEIVLKAPNRDFRRRPQLTA